MSAPSTRLFLGFDGGGTKTASVILDENRTELGRGLSGPCNIATTSDELLRVSVSQALSSALEAAGLPPETRFEAVCAGVAGYTAKRRRAEFARMLEELIPAERHRVEPDFKIAYWGATEGDAGIIVIAGTGAVVYGRNAEGEECRFDGRGFLLGDGGSGFDLGLTCLRWLVLKLDKGKPLTAFDVEVLASIGAEDADDIVEWVYRDFLPSRVASLSQTIGKLAAAGNEEARLLTIRQGWALHSAVSQVRRSLITPVDVPVYLLGSLWSLGNSFKEGFIKGNGTAPQTPPEPNLRGPLHDAAHGAALLALHEA